VAGPRPWGWHQLKPQWADALVAEAPIARGAVVLDIGAGTGAITRPLLLAGARVIAVEAHGGRAALLRDRFRGDLVVVEADAGDLRLPKKPYYVVASPPFGVSSRLLRRLLQPGSRLLAARLILQDQVVRRWAAPDAPGAARWAKEFRATVGRRIPRRAFIPPPHVDTRILAIDRRR
jgi:23S rRNA (adenine-N6)-dimethyltransferase